MQFQRQRGDDVTDCVGCWEIWLFWRSFSRVKETKNDHDLVYQRLIHYIFIPRPSFSQLKLPTTLQSIAYRASKIYCYVAPLLSPPKRCFVWMKHPPCPTTQGFFLLCTKTREESFNFRVLFLSGAVECNFPSLWLFCCHFAAATHPLDTPDGKWIWTLLHRMFPEEHLPIAVFLSLSSSEQTNDVKLFLPFHFIHFLSFRFFLSIF